MLAFRHFGVVHWAHHSGLRTGWITRPADKVRPSLVNISEGEMTNMMSCIPERKSRFRTLLMPPVKTTGTIPLKILQGDSFLTCQHYAASHSSHWSATLCATAFHYKYALYSVSAANICQQQKTVCGSDHKIKVSISLMYNYKTKAHTCHIHSSAGS